MHEVGLVLQEVVDALDDVPFTQHYLVPHGHEPVPHVCPQSMHKVYTSLKESLEEFFLDVAPVGEYLSVKLFLKHLPHTDVPVVHVSPCETECYVLPTVIAHQVQLEAVAPSHRALTVLGKAGENLVGVPPEVVAHGNHRAVNERYPGAFAKGVQPHEQQHLDEHLWHEFYESVVRDRVRELAPHLTKDTVQVILLEVAVSAEMVADENGHYLATGEPTFTVPMPFDACGFGRQKQVFTHFRV